MRALVFVLLLGACGGGRDEGQWPVSKRELGRASVDHAEQTYRRYCIGCHGADGRGNGGATGADFTQPGSALLSKSEAELITSVSEGRRGARASMPAHKPVLKPDEIAAVVGWVKREFAPR